MSQTVSAWPVANGWVSKICTVHVILCFLGTFVGSWSSNKSSYRLWGCFVFYHTNCQVFCACMCFFNVKGSSLCCRGFFTGRPTWQKIVRAANVKTFQEAGFKDPENKFSQQHLTINDVLPSTQYFLPKPDTLRLLHFRDFCSLLVFLSGLLSLGWRWPGWIGKTVTFHAFMQKSG